jgi:hypothetical protein
MPPDDPVSPRAQQFSRRWPRSSRTPGDSYAYAFRLFLEYATDQLRVPPSQMQLEQLDAAIVVGFLNHAVRCGASAVMTAPP